LLPASPPCDNRLMPRNPNPIGDPNVFIALAAENGAYAQRDADAWGVVADLARVLSLKQLGDRASLALAAEFDAKARDDLHKLMTSPLYAVLPPLAETNKHVHQLLVSLLESM